MNKAMFVIAFLLLASSVQAAEYFRSVDSAGKVHYGDRPLTDAAEVEKMKVRPAPQPNNTLSFETQRAKEKFPVTFYVAEECGDSCKQARDYLNKRGIPFTEKKLASKEEIETFIKTSGSDKIPVMYIGKKWLQGFLESQWSSALDEAGYPKSSPYGSRPAITPQ